MKHLFVILLLAISTFSYGQNNTVSWAFESKKTGKNEYTLYLKATIKDGWYVYSQYLESDDGPVRTEIVLEDEGTISLDGKAVEEGQQIKGYDNLFDMNIIKYKKHLTITQKIHTKGDEKVKGYITFMTCNDEQCLPPTDVPFEIKLK
ncbi:protein-disulfide reductase DsbD N-terminal domain-containing protein [Aureispira anguillae]|uniref:Protein-disulfide reductase DsbD N-terminal domain-containing protein n=1 Tax=Aureispira anguillae TaxID=2864201 RepID=A0A915YJ45_9BACT|nr:protein-disulfide reductase DsbD N-terminal domain-containing protein [Aureispira anguillae]BDS13954.1 protein-disulfide reductase DsbD N-terminal domain-containing protein [Aureispira anguillae]